MPLEAPSTEDIQKGLGVAEELRALGVRKILVIAAEQGWITEKKCCMEHCFSPGGRGWFVSVPALGLPRSPWEPTHEHAPRPKRSGGIREVHNAVLAHRRCNNVGHKLEALAEYLESIRLPEGGSLNPLAIEEAIEQHVAERTSRLGRYPRRRGSWKSAKSVAEKVHQDLKLNSGS